MRVSKLLHPRVFRLQQNIFARKKQESWYSQPCDLVHPLRAVIASNRRRALHGLKIRRDRQRLDAKCVVFPDCSMGSANATQGHATWWSYSSQYRRDRGQADYIKRIDVSISRMMKSRYAYKQRYGHCHMLTRNPFAPWRYYKPNDKAADGLKTPAINNN